MGHLLRIGLNFDIKDIADFKKVSPLVSRNSAGCLMKNGEIPACAKFRPSANRGTP
jgi:hypothetical protein